MLNTKRRRNAGETADENGENSLAAEEAAGKSEIHVNSDVEGEISEGTKNIVD